MRTYILDGVSMEQGSDGSVMQSIMELRGEQKERATCRVLMQAERPFFFFPSWFRVVPTSHLLNGPRYDFSRAFALCVRGC